MRATLIFVHILWMAAAANAGEALDLSAQAERCWSPPTKAEATGFFADFDVVLDDKGKVDDITVMRYSPENDLGKVIVLSASQAIELCSPYVGPDAHGKATITMRIANIFGPAIDPFKD